VTLNNAVNAIIDSDCDMSNLDLQFSNIDGNIEMIQNCVINQCVPADKSFEALCRLRDHINELLTESVRQSQHLIRRISIIAGEIHGVGEVENRLEIGLDELTDILVLVNKTGLLPNIEVSLRNSRDTVLKQMGPGRENDMIINSQLRRIRVGLRNCLDQKLSRSLRGSTERDYREPTLQVV